MAKPEIEFVRSAVDTESLIDDHLPQIAFAGRSNVGKSSLLNRLVGRRQLARISSKPGRTRMINYFHSDDGHYLVDLPGYGYAKASKSERNRWATLIDQYLRSDCRGGRLTLQLVDAKVGATALDQQAWEYFGSLPLFRCVVATKVDKVPRSRRHRTAKRIRQDLAMSHDEPMLLVSSTTGEGFDQLWKTVTEFLSSRETTSP